MPDIALSQNHEAMSKERYCLFQEELDKATNDDAALKILAAKVDIQLKLEDYLIKAPEAEHPKASAWRSLIIPIVTLVVSAIISYVVAVHK